MFMHFFTHIASLQSKLRTLLKHKKVPYKYKIKVITTSFFCILKFGKTHGHYSFPLHTSFFLLKKNRENQRTLRFSCSYTFFLSKNLGKPTDPTLFRFTKVFFLFKKNRKNNGYCAFPFHIRFF